VVRVSEATHPTVLLNPPKREERLDLPGQIMFIPNKNILLIVDLTILAAEIKMRGDIFDSLWKGKRKSSGRIDLAEQDIRDGITDFVTRIPCLYQSAGTINPR
jgi:hypothetical protein